MQAPRSMGIIMQRDEATNMISLVESEDECLGMNHRAIVGILRRSIENW